MEITSEEWLWIRRRLWGIAKKRAKEKGLEFTISVEDIPKVSVCPILQTPLVKHKGKMERNTPSLDRRDNRYGYIPGNVRVISWWANYLKAEMSEDQVLRLLEYMRYNHDTRI